MSLSKTVRFKVLVRDHFTCRYCGRSAPQVELHVDHVQPSSRGGSDDPSNLVAACVDCNLSKNGRVLPFNAPPAIEVASTPALLPHPDVCRQCRSRWISPVDERPHDSGAGYSAYYTCPNCGHHWRTYWSWRTRLTAEMIAAIAGDIACEAGRG
jgi:5-methylcytosine-specific restriction endonuclease McrA